MDCQLLCHQTKGCKAFTYITNSYNGVHGEGARKNCLLKTVNNGPTKKQEGLVSGPKVCPGKVLWFHYNIQFLQVHAFLWRLKYDKYSWYILFRGDIPGTMIFDISEHISKISVFDSVKMIVLFLLLCSVRIRWNMHYSGTSLYREVPLYFFFPSSEGWLSFVSHKIMHLTSWHTCFRST